MGDSFNKRYEGFNKYYADLKATQKKVRYSSINTWLSLSNKQRKNMSFAKYMEKRMDEATRRFDEKYVMLPKYRELIKMLVGVYKEEDLNGIINRLLSEVDVRTLKIITSELELLICMTDSIKQA